MHLPWDQHRLLDHSGLLAAWLLECDIGIISLNVGVPDSRLMI